MKCSGCDEEREKLRTWKNGKKYCLKCYEEIIVMEKEEKNHKRKQ